MEGEEKIDQNKKDDAVGNVGINEIDILKSKCEEYLNGWKRAKADFVNHQKDENKRFEQILKFGNENLIKDLLIILDSFSLATEALAKEILTIESSLINKKESPSPEKGLYLINSQLEDLLKKHGLEKIVVSIGQNFNPEIHEAVLEVESNQKSDTIVEEIEKGYTLHGKTLRPAKVKVAK